MNEEKASKPEESEAKVKVIELGNASLTSLKSKPRSSRKLVIIAIILLIIFVVVGLIYFLVIKPKLESESSKSQDVVRRSVCGNLELEIRQEYNKILAREDRSQLKDLVRRIETLDNFDSDPNCLIPLVAYNIHMYNKEKANQYMSSLQSTYSDDSVFGFFVTEPRLTDSLKLEIEGMELKNNSINESVIYY